MAFCRAKSIEFGTQGSSMTCMGYLWHDCSTQGHCVSFGARVLKRLKLNIVTIGKMKNSQIVWKCLLVEGNGMKTGTSRTYMGYFWPRSVQCQFKVIRCPRLKWPNVTQTRGPWTLTTAVRITLVNVLQMYKMTFNAVRSKTLHIYPIFTPVYSTISHFQYKHLFAFNLLVIDVSFSHLP